MKTIFACGVAASIWLIAWTVLAEDSAVRDRLSKAKQDLPQDTYQLQYKFDAGEVLRSKVVHLATTETRISGNTQTSKSRAVSTKVWEIIDVSDQGDITFVHSVEKVQMWQKVTGRPEVRYDSEKDETPPPQYEGVPETIGVPLVTVTIDRFGNVIDRQSDHATQHRLGLGNITVPLPADPIAVGDSWHAPDEVMVRLANGTVRRINIRKQYTLKRLQTGVATIDVVSQVLTPVNDPEVESQLVQQLTNGTIRFDVDAGRVMWKQMDWDESVVGFRGADSSMNYLARFTEELLSSERTSTAAKPPVTEDAEKPATGPALPERQRFKR